VGEVALAMSPVNRGLNPDTDCIGGKGLLVFCDRAASHSQPVSDESDRSSGSRGGSVGSC